MQFPTWIDRERDPVKRARLRLKHMLCTAALNKYGKASIRALARDAGCGHASVFNAINRGSFTYPMADAIQRVVGRDRLPLEALIAPLDVGAA